ncbi:BapA/Bap/LapF family prefix-like domain-containing protein [Wohlfahrtiimonas larvae]|uniref:BapA prefix-like domain-containing protein n=2 Tax=Wohlfahrtiimonas larvae TaxID=1157986 RepID=A0ABP9MVI8_9GAMM
MSTFVIVDKKSLNEISVDASNINLKAPSNVHTKLYRDDVAEFIQDGNNLILKLKNGKTITIANFFVKQDDEESELVFEDEDCGLPWLPFLLGGAGVAGAIAAVASDNGGDKNTTYPEVPTEQSITPTVTVTGYEDNVGKIVGNVKSGEATDDNKPVISGTATNAKTVEVTITDAEGQVLTKTATVEDGKWSLPELTEVLADGKVTITAVAKDALGRPVTSNTYEVTVDTKVDAGKPEIVTDLDGDSTITTTVDPEDVTKVEVIDPTTKQPIPGLVVKGPDDKGQVIITGKVPTDVMPELKVTDNVGNEKQVPIVDQTPKATVEVTGYDDNEGSIQGNVESGKATDDNTPVISGTATNAKTVEVTITDAEGQVLTKTATVEDGKWSLPELTEVLADGKVTITAVAKDALGRPVTSNTYEVIVDTKVDAGKPEIVTDLDGDSTITTTVDPKDVTKVEIVDKDGNPILDVKTGEPLVGKPDPITGEVKIEGKIPKGIEPELKVTDHVGNEGKTSIVDKTPTYTLLVEGNGDDTITGPDDSNNVLIGDQGGLHTNFVAGQDHNVAVVLDVSGSIVGD